MSFDTLSIFVMLVCGAIAIAVGVALANRSERKRMEGAFARFAARPRPQSAPRAEPKAKGAQGRSRRPAAAALRAPSRPFKIGLGEPGSLDVGIERCPPQFAGRLVEIPAHADLTSRLSPLLQHAPTLVPSPGVAAGQDLYVMTFSPAVAQGLVAGTYDLGSAAERGFHVFAVDEDGVVRHETLTADAALQPAGLTIAFWQVFSIVVGQRHLASADERLKRLADEAAEIRPFLESGRWSRLSGQVASLERILSALHPFARSRPRSRDDCAEVRGQLESVERGTREDLDAIRAEIVTVVRGALGAGLGDFLGSDRDVSAAAERIEQFSVPVRQRNLAFFTRGVAAQLLACLPGYQEPALRWVGQIADDAVRESRLDEAGNAFLRLIDKKIESEARAKLVVEDRERLTARLDAARQSLSEQRGALLEALEDLHDALEAQLQEQQRATVLVARLDRTGRVRHLFRPG
jgi:hypothetical protein